MIAKLVALSEHYCNFAPLLPVARSIREQFDWPRIRAAVVGRPYGEAFVFLRERLGVVAESAN